MEVGVFKLGWVGKSLMEIAFSLSNLVNEDLLLGLELCPVIFLGVVVN